jgi:hypothetical protein
MTTEMAVGYNQMIGHTTQLTYLIDPSFANISGPCTSTGGPSQICAPRNALPETTLYIPLQFWYNTNPGLSLPLIALTAGQKNVTHFTSEYSKMKNCFDSHIEQMFNNQTLVSCY